MADNSLDVRRQEDLVHALTEADSIVVRKYLDEVAHYPVKRIDTAIEDRDINTTVRMNRIEKIVFNTDENCQDKLMNVYNAVALCGGSLVNVIVSDGKTVDYYIGTRTETVDAIATSQAVLKGTFEGNFPGSKISLQRKNDLGKCIDYIFGSEREEKNRIVSVVTGIPAFRNESKDQEGFVQGIEKVIDSMKGQKFAIVTIADSVSKKRMIEIRENYESLYSQLSPFAQTSLSYSESDSNAVAESITEGITKTIGSSVTNTVSNSTSTTEGVNQSTSGGIFFGVPGIGGSLNTTKGTSSSSSKQNGSSLGESQNESESDSRTVGKTDTYTNTSGRSLQINFENKRISNLMQRIEKQIARIDDSMDLGLWDTATYCIADDSQTSQMLAGAMESLCRGEKSTIESFAVGTWSEGNKLRKVSEYLERFMHPVLKLQTNTGKVDIHPTSLISGKELVIEAGLPQRSLNGVPVTEMVPFSRNIVCEDDTEEQIGISLGKVSYLNDVEATVVKLQKESITSHAFITGSTGSGKSNTVYQIINEMMKEKVSFLVIEPAKGEYKNVFGNRADVNVFGTNEKICELLKINPFSFPEEIHVLEHVDRLIEIFNVCWPMYAAMPAVLKDSVLRAYEECGWNLDSSENIYGKRYFPTFADVLRELTFVIDHSAYSAEVKGNYIGSLATRIKSLTNGINGKIFAADETDECKLFDENTIIDLSRVGSTETKSLLMGILVMKLNEYRISGSNGLMNQKLKHITILEEAHNLLKNTTLSSGAEGADIAAKSVEMISNSIAEMRTYGEGFVIVDQSPGAVDISAIRNTNTKIIMRLPEESDRQQAGKSAALTDKQIPELAKLPRGIAVVYQNNWMEPVLCKIDKVNVSETAYVYSKKEPQSGQECRMQKQEVLKMLMKHRVDENLEIDFEQVRQAIEKIRISTRNKILLEETLQQMKEGTVPVLCNENLFESLSGVVVEILDLNNHLDKFVKYKDMAILQDELMREINRNAGVFSKEVELAISQCILRQLVKEDEEQVELYARWREFAVEQRKLV